MAEQIEASRRVVIEALVLVFSRSKISKLVGTDALRTVITAEYRQHVSNGQFRFESLWSLLESQPGFDPELASAPVCRFKSWEKLLGLSVELPAALRNLSEAQIRQYAAQCEVPAHDLQALLRSQTAPPPDDINLPGGAKRAAKSKASGSHRAARATGSKKAASASGWQRRRGVLIGVAVLAVLGFGITGVRLYQGCNPTASYSGVAVVELGQSVPIARAERFGSQIRVYLADDGWLATPEGDRKTALGAMFDKVRAKGATALLVHDKSGKLRASAQPLSGSDLAFKFY